MIKVIQTTKDYFWKEISEIKYMDSYKMNVDTIFIDNKKKFQTHMGFGGAFTEAAAYTFYQTSEANRKEIANALYDSEQGLGYNLGRICMNGSDFSLEYYSYIQDNDDKLETFDIAHDEQWVIPMIDECRNVAGKEIWFLVSTWSAPAFMKTNKDVNHGGRILPKYKKIWAKYYVRFIEELKKRGVKVSAITIQNEPEAIQTWASCEYSAAEEAEFLIDDLYPELKKNDLTDIKIYIWDHNRDNMVRRTNETLAYKNAGDLVWGVAYHWYVSTKHENLSMIHDMFPEKHLLFTEGCVELIGTSLEDFSDAGSWANGELYGRNIIQDFNNYSEGWIDWNMVLNEQGGPNYVSNYCEAPIMVDRESDKIIKNPSYYYIGHFSRYIKSGATRITCRNDADKKLYTTAYENPDGEIVLVVQNEAKERDTVIVMNGQGFNITIPAHSITTFLIDE